MSTLEVNTIKPISGSSTVTLGESGDTISVASGATLSDQKNYATWKLSSNLDTGSSTNITNVTIVNSANITHSSGTFTITKAGLYQISFTATFITSGGERQVGCTIKVNDSGVLSARDQVADVESGNNFGSATVNVVQELSVNDTIKFQIDQSYADGNISAYADLTNGTIVRIA